MRDLATEKEELEKSIVENLILALEREKITEKEMSTISGFVLKHIDTIHNDREIVGFLEELSKRWEIFKPLLILKQAESEAKVEDEVAEGVLMLLEHGKIDNAIKLAQSVTNKH